MSSLSVVRTRKRFEPPVPEPVSPLAVACGIGLVAVIVLVDRVTDGLLGSALAWIPTPSKKPTPVPDVMIAGTTAPIVDASGNVPCTRCGRSVAYSSMSLDEDGYFCAPCAATLVAEAE